MQRARGKMMSINYTSSFKRLLKRINLFKNALYLFLNVLYITNLLYSKDKSDLI